MKQTGISVCAVDLAIICSTECESIGAARKFSSVHRSGPIRFSQFMKARRAWRPLAKVHP